MDSEPRASFSDLLRQARRNAGLTQEALAERAGLSTRAVSNLERGINRAPHRETLDMLAAALDLSPEDRAQWERARSRLSTRTSGKPPERAVHGHHLPLALTSFYGRDGDVDGVARLLCCEQTRLLTVTGAGGIGKTRLSLAAATSIAARFRDGATFVPLAAVSHAGQVPDAIAQALGVREGAGQSVLDALRKFLSDRDLLLLLDNFEHVVSAATDVGILLGECSRLKVLVTSRVPLRLSGELEYPLRPLDVDASVSLFVDRLQARMPHFQPSGDDVEAIAAICRRLDGLPLAIELAAARSRVLPPAALLQRLARPLDILTNGARDLPSRQQTLRATIDWSYNLLAQPEQELFRRISVFMDGWSLEAADAVGDGDALDALSRLVEINLVERYEESGAEPRYRMLETIREFGHEMLRRLDEEDSARQLHAHYVSHLLSQAPPFVMGAQQIEWLDRLEREYSNIQVALDWCLEHDIERGLRMLATLWAFWWLRTPLTLARQYYDLFLVRVDDSTDPEAVALASIGAGIITEFQDENGWDRAADHLKRAIDILAELPHAPKVAYWSYLNLGGIELRKGNLQQAEDYYHQALDYSRCYSQPIGETSVILLLGQLNEIRGNRDSAMEWYQTGLAIARDIGDPFLTAVYVGTLGGFLTESGRFEAARPLIEESLALDRAIKLTRHIASDFEDLASVELYEGNLDAAEQLFGQCITEAAKVNELRMMGWGHLGLARIALKRGDPSTAIARSHLGLRLVRIDGDHACIARAVETLAMGHSRLDNLHLAVKLHAWTAAFRDCMGIPPRPLVEPEIQQDLDRLRQALSPLEFASAWESGATLTLDDICAGPNAEQEAGQPGPLLASYQGQSLTPPATCLDGYAAERRESGTC